MRIRPDRPKGTDVTGPTSSARPTVLMPAVRLSALAAAALGVACGNFAFADEASDAAVRRLNDLRKIAGLPAVTLDAELSKACAAHAKYLDLNPDIMRRKDLSAHEEDPKRPGYSAAGAKAARDSVIAMGMGGPAAAIDNWMGTFYHRIPLLHPGLKRIGVGASGAYSVVEYRTHTDNGQRFDSFTYPVDRQASVPAAFSGNETPDPVPESRDGRAGYPVTVTFFPSARVTGVEANLYVGDLTTAPKGYKPEAVECWVSHPEKLANPNYPAIYQENSICLMAKRPLQAGTVYTVVATATVGGQPWRQVWRFSTGPVNGWAAPSQPGQPPVAADAGRTPPGKSAGKGEPPVAKKDGKTPAKPSGPASPGDLLRPKPAEEPPAAEEAPKITSTIRKPSPAELARGGRDSAAPADSGPSTPPPAAEAPAAKPGRKVLELVAETLRDEDEADRLHKAMMDLNGVVRVEIDRTVGSLKANVRVTVDPGGPDILKVIAAGREFDLRPAKSLF
jgi:uncharacterized protein YkwD